MKRGKGLLPNREPKFREKDTVKLNSRFAGPSGLIGATGTVTRGSYGRKNAFIYVQLDDQNLANHLLHGDPVVMALPTEIDLFRTGKK